MQKRALVLGASGGIGQALAGQLAERGVTVTCLSRSQDGLDITCESNIAELFSKLETPFDLVIVATGILSEAMGPEKTIRALTAEELIHLFAVNTIGPALVLKHVQHLLPRDRRAVFAALSARVGSIGDNTLGGWYSYRASKAALNQMIRTASIELKRSHKHLVCIALHPGTVATDFTQNYPAHTKVTPQEAANNLLKVIDTLAPEDSGRFLDWAGNVVPW